MARIVKCIYYFFKGFKITLPVITLIFVSIVTYKALINKNKIDTYEEFFTIVTHKEDNNLVFDYDNNLVLEKYNGIEVDKYINCLKEEVKIDNLSDKAKLSIKTLENLYNQSNNYFAFKYTDIYTGFTISYNANQEIFAASTIKAPMAIYLYNQAELGNIDLEEKLTYTSSYYNSGTGILKNKAFNKSYTVRELISYAIIYSDNAAYNMLMDRFGRENMYNFWKDKNTTSIFRLHTNWGMVNANDATIYMKELYDYYNTNTILANELMQNFQKVVFKPLSNASGKKNTANKSGWSGTAFHDAAIVFEDNPYILVVLSNLGYTDYNYLFNLTSKVVGNLHEEYWNVKYEMCKDIIK